MIDIALHLSTVIEGEENQETFCKELMKQLNAITFNGQRKISEVLENSIGGSIVVRFDPFKTMPKESYYFRLNKMGKVCLD